MPLVLVQNEVTADPAHNWDDVEGVHYHYPSKYRNKISTGEQFVYYVGVHRADGRRRPHGEYFGTGTIGEIWEDPSKERSWYCSIENYERFTSSVPAKINGESIEIGPSNMWRDGVRKISQDTLDRILDLSGRNPPTSAPKEVPHSVNFIDSNVIVPKGKRRPGASETQAQKHLKRRSHRAKAIGDLGEALAIQYISERVSGATDIVHREAQNERPGWDIDYSVDGSLNRVEVKSTTSAAFSNVTLTANEMAAAKKFGERYSLMLIASCETANPRVQIINNPYQKIENGTWISTPESFDVILD